MRSQLTGLLVSILFISGCTAIISPESMKTVNTDVSFKTLKEAPESYIGKNILLGGRIAAVKNSQDGARIEIVQFELTTQSYPADTSLSYGRFLATNSSYMDPLIFRGGMLMTLVGEVKGKKTQRLDDMDYTYPVIAVKEWYLWPESGLERGSTTYPGNAPQYDPYNYGFGYEPFLRRP
jgi:outer membrane lipoprotein